MEARHGEMAAGLFAWRVWRPGQKKEDGHIILAPSAETAAEKWAEWADSFNAAFNADYSIVGGKDAEVIVSEDTDDAQENRFRVSGEVCAVYTSHPTVIKDYLITALKGWERGTHT